MPGLDSGFASDLADTTNSAGHFSIANVPFHTYRLFSVTGAGYEPSRSRRTSMSPETSLQRSKLIRDWASIEGGAKVGKFTPPDYGPFNADRSSCVRP